MGLIGAGIGISSAFAFLNSGNFVISAEGLSIVFNIHSATIMKAAILAGAISLCAGIYPAVLSLRGSLVNRLRSN